MTKKIGLTQGKVALVDDEDYEWLSQWKWCFDIKKGKRTGYAKRIDRSGPRQKTVLMHRAILKHHNPQLGHFITDHINGNGIDNRKVNLRKATYSQNARNQRLHRDSSSLHKGVYQRKDCQKWCARITKNGECICLGHFDNELEAARAYDRAAIKHHGEFCSLNFPKQHDR